jgi:hypothetical protein
MAPGGQKVARQLPESTLANLFSPLLFAPLKSKELTEVIERAQKHEDRVLVMQSEVLSNDHVGQIGVKRSSGYQILDRSTLDTVQKGRGRNPLLGKYPD